MSVGLIIWGRFLDKNGNKITVPAPPDETGKPWLWDFIAQQVSELAAAGFDTIQLPPASKAFGGTAPGTDGYGMFDPRDLGDKNQMGSLETRYGSAESGRRAFANAHACGLNVYVDLVLHQRQGGNNGFYDPLGSDGKTKNGRGALNPGCLRVGPGETVPPFRWGDSVPVAADDFEFGNELVYENCDPAGYTINDAIDWVSYVMRTLDADGARVDDTKGTNANFIAKLMNSPALAGVPVYSEYDDGNVADLNWWATSAPLNGRSAVEDFANHYNGVQAACDGGDARVLNGAGYTSWRPDLSVTFVDNPDTDTTPGQQVISAKLLGYAFLATIPARLFLVYGKDYYGDDVWPGAYGLKKWIDNLVYINQRYAYGKTITQYVDSKVIVLNRDGDGGSIGRSPGLLTALNFDTYNRRTITCPTTFGGNAHLHDVTGRHADIWTDGQGRATFTIPSNAYNNGQSYLCFTIAGHDGSVVPKPRSTTQTFFGSPDLSIGPATPTGSFVARIWCDQYTEVSLNHLDGDGVRFKVVDAGDTVIIDTPTVWSARTARRGWHTITATAPGKVDVPYTLECVYTGTKGLTSEEMVAA